MPYVVKLMFTNLCVCITLCTFYILRFTSACGKATCDELWFINMAFSLPRVLRWLSVYLKNNNNYYYINIILVYSYYTFSTVFFFFNMEYKELLNPFHVFRQNILFDLISKLVTISKDFK